MAAFIQMILLTGALKEMVTEMVTGVFNELFFQLVTPLYMYGHKIFIGLLKLSMLSISQTPADFSPAAWSFTVDTLYPWINGVAAILLNIFFMVSMCRQMTNLRQNFTLEIFVESMIKLVSANLILQSGILIVKEAFDLAAKAGGAILKSNPPTFTQADTDRGAILFYVLLGIVYLLVCLICGGMIFLAVYGRYIQLYLLVFSMPIAISTIAGGQGISSTAVAWFKTFLAKTFSIVIIAAAIAISSRLCGGINFASFIEDSAYDGALEAIKNIAVMVLLASSVNGVDNFMRRVFGL